MRFALSPSLSNDLHVSDTTNKHNKHNKQTQQTNTTNKHKHSDTRTHKRKRTRSCICLCTCTCRRHSFCAKKHETIVESRKPSNSKFIYIYIYCLQHKTAQRMTARRSVIHPSFYPSSVLVTVRAKKIPKLFQARKSFSSFTLIRSLLQDPGYFWPELWVKIKNSGWQSLWPAWYLSLLPLRHSSFLSTFLL